MSVTERTNPTHALTGGLPTPSAELGHFIEEQKSQCGVIVDSIDWVIHKFTGWSLIETLYKPFAGDWDAIDSMRQAWPKVAESIDAVGDNYRGMKSDLPSVWAGDGADAAIKRLDQIIDYHANQAQGCRELSSQLGHVLDVSKAAIEVVTLVLNFLDSLAQELLTDLAMPVIGEIKAAATAPWKITKACRLIEKAAAAIKKLTTLLTKIPAIARYINVALTTSHEVLSFGNTALGVDAGMHMAGTSQQAFT